MTTTKHGYNVRGTDRRGKCSGKQISRKVLSNACIENVTKLLISHVAFQEFATLLKADYFATYDKSLRSYGGESFLV